MKPLRLVSTPTRNRRLNEILGIAVMACAGLLLLALATYTPTDPSADTVGGYVATGTGLGARLAEIHGSAHNWTGLVGAWLADALLQLIGIAAFFLPIILGRLGFCWFRQRPAGSATARFLGLGLWIVFAPAAIGLIPHEFFWRHALHIEGITGRLLADTMVHYLNLPGATIVLILLVAMSLYLATTFTFHTASEWIESHFSIVRRIHERIQDWRIQRAVAKAEKRGLNDQAEPMPSGVPFTSKREQNLEKASQELERERAAQSPESTTLLSSLFGWWGRMRRKRALAAQPGDLTEQPAVAPVSMWESMPRTNVYVPPVTALSTAAAAAAPYAEALAAAAAPGSSRVDLPEMPPARVPPPRAAEPAPLRPVPVPARAPAAQSAHEPISFGKRADADIKPVTITPKSIRG